MILLFFKLIQNIILYMCDTYCRTFRSRRSTPSSSLRSRVGHSPTVAPTELCKSIQYLKIPSSYSECMRMSHYLTLAKFVVCVCMILLSRHLFEMMMRFFLMDPIQAYTYLNADFFCNCLFSIPILSYFHLSFRVIYCLWKSFRPHLLCTRRFKYHCKYVLHLRKRMFHVSLKQMHYRFAVIWSTQ